MVSPPLFFLYLVVPDNYDGKHFRKTSLFPSVNISYLTVYGTSDTSSTLRSSLSVCPFSYRRRWGGGSQQYLVSFVVSVLCLPTLRCTPRCIYWVRSRYLTVIGSRDLSRTQIVLPSLSFTCVVVGKTPSKSMLIRFLHGMIRNSRNPMDKLEYAHHLPTSRGTSFLYTWSRMYPELDWSFTE